jgi:SAM-dependent methyltransferase
MDNHRSAHHQHGHEHHSGIDTNPESMTELLDLDGEVLHSYLTEVMAWVHELAGEPPLGESGHRILDLGSGTGTGALALAQRFDDAEVTAVDLSPQLLDRLMEKARGLGLAERVHTVQADLDEPWPAIGTADVVWASSSLHHLKDPHRVLTDVLAALRPGGLLVVAELVAFPRFLPEDLGLGRPGLEERCHAILFESVTAELPHLGADWGVLLAEAGFAVAAERPFVIELTAPLPAATGRYARATLERIRSAVEGRVSAEDLEVLDKLISSDGPDSVLHREDLTVRTTRTVWAARRP